MFNISCESKQQQRSCYSKTILYNGDSTINTSITGLLPNTIYTCCVLAVTSYGESEPVCQNITTHKTTSELFLLDLLYQSMMLICYYFDCQIKFVLLLIHSLLMSLKQLLQRL